jgi:hypothetical protein
LQQWESEKLSGVSQKSFTRLSDNANIYRDFRDSGYDSYGENTLAYGIEAFYLSF